MLENTENISNSGSSGGILDAVLESEQAHALAEFNPHALVSDILNNLRDRERQIVTLRYGLAENKPHTLESIGNRLDLTRERVRQIEKESLRQLKNQEVLSGVNRSMDIIKKTVQDHGSIFGENALIDHLLISSKTERQINSLLFLLELSEYFNLLEETERYHRAWYTPDFELPRLHTFHDSLENILENHGVPLQFDDLKEKFKQHSIYLEMQSYFNDRVIENLIRVSKTVKANPFGEFGLKSWRVVHPRDVGDKAYLVLAHEKKPLHYTKITELINQQGFDDRTAYKETVHNELIMDERFILVGRGIYALSDWGYKKGVVADIIKEILSAGEPMERNAIVEEVLKQRLVRRNTILVGLADKKLFKKIGKSRYTLP
ncbi:MAG: hypothetical protein HY397_03265 [Candidatus Doudnabacteria bacterium]|nr:hypothetical protein [Candidatus Doudnabacteria bacterium]